MSRKTLKLEVIGKDENALTETTEGKPLRIFGKTEGEYHYKIEFNEENKPSLWQVQTDPGFSMSCVPFISEKYVTALNEGKTLLIDNDIVRLVKN